MLKIIIKNFISYRDLLLLKLFLFKILFKKYKILLQGYKSKKIGKKYNFLYKFKKK